MSHCFQYDCIKSMHCIIKTNVAGISFVGAKIITFAESADSIKN